MHLFKKLKKNYLPLNSLETSHLTGFNPGINSNARAPNTIPAFFASSDHLYTGDIFGGELSSNPADRHNHDRAWSILHQPTHNYRPALQALHTREVEVVFWQQRKKGHILQEKSIL